MAVEYIDSGESPTADKLNEIFEEADRKLGLAFDQKSFYVALPDDETLIGREFFFVNGTPLYASGANYDHSVFTASAAAATEVSRDEDLLIMTVSGSSLENSLEAHAREGYYLKEQNTTFPEKKYKYAVAELIYEGIGFATVFFPKAYNKFNFFRIHNLNPYAMSFIFEKTGGSETFSVPAMGCLCVRRDSVDGTYNGDWNYLWKAEAGDPRFFTCMATQNASPIISMRANNVSDVQVIYRWAAALAAGVGGVTDPLNPDADIPGARWHFDPHEVQDISEDYCPDYYPDPSDTTKPAGDFFHHKGEVFIGETRYTFNGYATITTDIPQLGIDNLTNETITVSPAAGATQITTNLFSQSVTSRPTVDAHTPTVLDNTNTGETNLLLLETYDESVTVGSLTITRETIRGAANQGNPSDFSFHLDTLADVLTLNNWGNEEYTASSQDTDACTITNRRFVFTPIGPRILFDEQIDLNGSWWAAETGTSASNPFGDFYATPSGAGLIRLGAVWFGGYGWPQFVLLDGVPLWQELAHLSPRVERNYANVDGREHPNISSPYEGADGADFGLTPIRNNNVRTEYAFATNINLLAPEDSLDQRWRIWENPDELYEQGMPRVPLLKEHFNAMAQLLNSVKKIEPLTFRSMRLLIPSVAGGADDTATTIPAPNNTGITSNACPITQYCSFSANSATERFFQRLGVPIRTHDDFPDDYEEAVNTAKAIVVLQSSILDTYVAEPSPNLFTVERIVESSTSEVRENEGNDVLTPVPSFRWVTIGEVKAAVEALGWKFVYQQAFTVHSLQVVDLEHVGLHDAPGGTYTYEFLDFSPFATVGQENRTAASTFYFKRRAVFMDDLAGEWKIATTAPAIYDAKPADILTAGYEIEGFDKFVVKELICEDEDLRRALGAYHPSIGYQAKYGLYQNLYSDGLENESVAFLLPITWADHSSSELSRGTYDEAITGGWLNSINGSVRQYDDHPIEEAVRSGETTYANLGFGNTLISHQGKALEVVPMVRVFVDAEA